MAESEIIGPYQIGKTMSDCSAACAHPTPRSSAASLVLGRRALVPHLHRLSSSSLCMQWPRHLRQSQASARSSSAADPSLYASTAHTRPLSPLTCSPLLRCVVVQWAAMSTARRWPSRSSTRRCCRARTISCCRWRRSSTACAAATTPTSCSSTRCWKQTARSTSSWSTSPQASCTTTSWTKAASARRKAAACSRRSCQPSHTATDTASCTETSSRKTSSSPYSTSRTALPRTSANSYAAHSHTHALDPPPLPFPISSALCSPLCC